MYILGGSNTHLTAGAVKSVDVYDAATKQVTTRADMSTERWSFGAAAVGNRVCVCGGRAKNNDILRSTECFNPETNSWTNQQDMSVNRVNHAVTALGGYMYAIGGRDANDVNFNSCERFDIGANVWSSVASLSVARHSLGAATMAGYIYAVGGGASTGASKVVEKYTSSSNTWERMGDMVTPTFGVAATVWNNQLVVVAGKSSSVLNTMQVYDAKEDTWSTSTSTLATARYYLRVEAVWGCYGSAVLVEGKCVCPIGYYGDPTAKASANCVKCPQGTWTFSRASIIKYRRCSHSSYFLVRFHVYLPDQICRYIH